MAGISSTLGGLDAFVANANNVITFKMVRSKEDLEDESIDFYPEYSHQIFSESELIFGYNGLKIGIYYTASRLLPYFTMSFKNMFKQTKKDDICADDVHKIISEKLEIPLPTNIDEFVSSLEKESTFKPFGKMIKSFQLDGDANPKQTYEVYRCDISVPGFREYHSRMQTFVMWFIDAASYIDDDDDRWEYFQIYERTIENGDPRYYFIGYSTVYRYYAFPTKVRPRISQMLVLPPFQKRGLGAEFLQSMYDWYICDSDVLDITVEDPSEEFIRLRDYVDCKNCMELQSFREDLLLQGFSNAMCKETQEKFKICKRQARRVYEILRLRITNVNNKNEYRKYRLLVKQRLNAPFQRQKLDMEKIKNSLTPEELAATKTPTEQRISQLEHSYRELEDEYKRVISGLAGL